MKGELCHWQDGKGMPRSCANSGKYLRFQKKIISDHLRKQVISVVSQDPFQWAKKQLPRTYIICLYLLSFVYKMQPFTMWSVFQSVR